jgi:hypothetical protein
MTIDNDIRLAKEELGRLENIRMLRLKDALSFIARVVYYVVKNGEKGKDSLRDTRTYETGRAKMICEMSSGSYSELSNAFERYYILQILRDEIEVCLIRLAGLVKSNQILPEDFNLYITISPDARINYIIPGDWMDALDTHINLHELHEKEELFLSLKEEIENMKKFVPLIEGR